MSSRRRVAIALLSAAPLLAACGSSGGESEASLPPATVAAAATAPATTLAAAGSIGDAVEVMAGAIPAADAATCDVIRRTLETATEAYLAMNGASPASQADLVTDGWMQEAAPQFEVADGTVQPVAAGPCVGH